MTAIPPEILRRVRRVEVASRRAAAGTLAGRWRSAFRGRGLAFEDVRPYAPGDEVRAIDWNVTARTGTLHVKRHAEERELTVAIALDVSPSMDHGSGARTKLAAAGEAAALVALAAAAGGDRTALLPFAGAPLRFVPPRRGRRHALAIAAAALGAAPSPGATDLAAALARLRSLLARRAVVLVASDFLAPVASWERPLGALARRHEVVALVVEDPSDAEPPAAGLVVGEDPESGRTAVVDLADRRVRERLALLRERAREERDGAIRAAGAEALVVDATEDPLARLVRLLDRRTRRGA